MRERERCGEDKAGALRRFEPLGMSTLMTAKQLQFVSSWYLSFFLWGDDPFVDSEVTAIDIASQSCCHSQFARRIHNNGLVSDHSHLLKTGLCSRSIVSTTVTVNHRSLRMESISALVYSRLPSISITAS